MSDNRELLKKGGDVYKSFARIKDSDQLESGLFDMCVKKGFSNERAYATVVSVVECVDEYEKLFERLSFPDGVASALEPLYASLAKLPDAEQRAEALDRIVFGFEYASSDSLHGAMRQMNDGESFYQDWRRHHPRTENEAELKQRLERQIAAMNVSSEGIERMAKALRNSGNRVAKAAALGRDGYMLKCVTALHLFLEDPENSSLASCVQTACADVNMQAIGDAVARGMLTRKRAYRIAQIALIAAVALGIILFYATTAPAAAGAAAKTVASASAAAKAAAPAAAAGAALSGVDLSKLIQPELPKIFSGFDLLNTASKVSKPVQQIVKTAPPLHKQIAQQGLLTGISLSIVCISEALADFFASARVDEVLKRRLEEQTSPGGGAAADGLEQMAEKQSAERTTGSDDEWVRDGQHDFDEAPAPDMA